MDEIISYKMCAVKVRNAKLRNYLNYTLKTGVFNYTPRCVLLHTKVCLITHQGVYILHTFLHSFRKHAIVC